MKSILLFSAAFIMLPLAANAQQREYSPGINYTALPTNILPKAATEPENSAQAPVSAPMAPQAPAAPQVNTAAAPVAPQMQAPAQAPVEEDTKVRIWNKYKELAAGEAEPATEPAQAQTQQMQTKTTLSKMDQPGNAPSPSGMSAILQNWESNKNQQSEMRSRSFATPAALEHLRSKHQAPAAEAAPADPQ